MIYEWILVLVLNSKIEVERFMTQKDCQKILVLSKSLDGRVKGKCVQVYKN